MTRTRNTYWWGALAALGMLGTTLSASLAQCASPNGTGQGPARWAGSGSTMRIAQTQAQTPQSTPVTAAEPMEEIAADSPFVDDPAAPMGDPTAPMGAAVAPPAGDGLWQQPPELPGSNCGNCWDNDDCCTNTGCCTPKCGCWYGGADYLLAKPHFSQGYAGLACQTVTTSTTTTDTQVAVPFPYRYSSMYRLFLGYHLSDCGGDVNFTYWNLQSTAATTMGPSSADGTVFFLGQLNNNAGVSTTSPAAGQYLGASSGIRVNIYDVDFSKYLIYGGPGRPGDCDFCPRWDMRWIAGVRIAQVNRFDNNVVTNANDGTIAAAGNINANFYGAGPKVGMQARRYIGEAQRFSVYAKGSMSLLLGQFHGNRTLNTAGIDGGVNVIATAVDNTSRVIPVADIEVGGSYQLYPQFFISAGYFVQCWWDLGYGETIGTSSSSAFTSFGSLDTANIMAWTGLFVRAELFF